MTLIATWNVNSLRVRLPQVLDWVSQHQPDVLALQETKMTNENFPADEIKVAGYHVIYNGQKTYNGVAILSRKKTTDLIETLPNLADEQRRVLGATVGGYRILNVYVPNGQSPDSDKYQYKLDWLKKLSAYVKTQLSKYPKFILLGDFNIAPEDRDVYDPKAWAGNVLVSPPERAALKGLMDLGLHDAFRLFDQPDKSYSWWDYRRLGFQLNHGLRLDLILISQAVISHCQRCEVDKAPRRLKQPSDHAPVMLWLK